MVKQNEQPLTETCVRQIAEDFVVQKKLDKCHVISVRRGADLESQKPVWYVQFQFECAEDESANHAFVQVDDATGDPKLILSL